ncbi:hypothetical protein BC943DRAFT_327871 [Umbelopsis sp. AD052]|nr:hypothetical protein BC943DRAFT_327871 [Umbelopsis sp. AD052]
MQPSQSEDNAPFFTTSGTTNTTQPSLKGDELLGIDRQMLGKRSASLLESTTEKYEDVFESDKRFKAQDLSITLDSTVSESSRLSKACQACWQHLRSCTAHCFLGGFGLNHVTNGSKGAQHTPYAQSVCSKHCSPLQQGDDVESCLCLSERCSECKLALPDESGFVVGTAALGVVSGVLDSKMRYTTLLRRALGPGMDMDSDKRKLATTRAQGACMGCGLLGVQGHWVPSHIPRKMVDVRAWALIDTSRLCAQCYSAASDYAIVSHEWGPSPNHAQADFSATLLNTGWQPRFRSDTGIGLEAAVRQASACYGTDYVWIDSLCVDQTEKEDVQVHLMNMAHYYTTATGCLAVASSNKSTPKKLEYDGACFWLHEASVKDKWYTRAWTLPEMLKCRECWLLVEAGVCVNISSILQLTTHVRARPDWIADPLFRVATAIRLGGLQHTYASVMYMLQTRHASRHEDLIMAARAVLGCTGSIKEGVHPDHIVANTLQDLAESGDTTWLGWLGASGNTRSWACMLPSAHAGYSWLSLTYGIRIPTEAVTLTSRDKPLRLRLMMEQLGSVIEVAAYGVFAADQIIKYICSEPQVDGPMRQMVKALALVYGDSVINDTWEKIPSEQWNAPASRRLQITSRTIGQISRDEGTMLHAAASRLCAFGGSTVMLCKVKLANGDIALGVIEKPVPLGTLVMRVQGASDGEQSMLLYCSSSGATLHRIAAGVGYVPTDGQTKPYLVG